jgi:hypothetical protein
MWASGRHFDETLIGRIQAAVDAEPGMSRRALSRRVCEWMGWHATNGAPQDMSCRKALLKLEGNGLLRLPAVFGQYAFQQKRTTAAKPSVVDTPRVQTGLEALGAVEVVAVASRHSQASRVWNELMEAHHPLGAGPLCGAQIRYLVQSEGYGWLGALAFSSATWRLAAREQWIGWSERARRAHLGQLILNSRFLILPTVEVPNLASHVLGKALGQLREDWPERYGVEPVLVETFVDPQRHAGTVYQAANWIEVGQTAAREDPYPNGKISGGPKDVYVYPLRADWQASLCREPERRLGTSPPLGRPPEDWAEEEFGRVDWADARLRERLLVLARDFMAQPGKPIPQACNGSQAKVKAAYRFCDNPQVDLQTVLWPHVESTVERIRAHEVVLAVQDTTDLNYTHHPATKELGPLGSIDDLTVGLKLHDTMAFTPQGTPLGLLDVQCWARDGSTEGQGHRRKRLPIEEKESFKWIESYRAVAEAQRLCPDTMLVSVGDREADIYELFQEALATPAGPKLLVRAERSRQRKVQQPEGELYAYLWDHMARQPASAFLELLIPRNGQRPAREARLAVRFAPVQIQPPQGANGSALAIWAVYAHEVDYDPRQVKEPLSWMLLTTIETVSAEQACERLEWYAKRWGIEIYHRTLKSGCRIEDRRLGEADGLEACLAIDMVVAWRVHCLVYQGRETPDIGCDVFLEQGEWKPLHAYIHHAPPPEQPPPLAEAVWMIGKLGGHLGPLAGSPPGPMTIWRGLCRVPDIAAGWNLRELFGLNAQPP